MSDEYSGPRYPGEYPDATGFPEMSARYNGEPLQGIRITSDGDIIFGSTDDQPVSITLRPHALEVRKEGELVSFTTGEWEDGVRKIDADGVDADLALVAVSEQKTEMEEREGDDDE